MPRLIVGRCSWRIGAGAAVRDVAAAAVVVVVFVAAAEVTALVAAAALPPPSAAALRWHGDSFQLVSSLFHRVSRASCSLVMGAGAGRSMSWKGEKMGRGG